MQPLIGREGPDALETCPERSLERLPSETRLSRGGAASGFRTNVLLSNAGFLFTLGLVAFLYTPSLRFQFVYDDVYQIALNPHVHSWRFFPVYFTQSVWSQVTGSTDNFYRPFFLLWLRINYLAFGDEPAGWHLTAVLVHLLATVLVHRLARALGTGRIAAFLAAIVFGLHPIHLEAVAWASGVTESLASTFFLAALVTYVQWKKAGQYRSLWLAASVGLFAAALLVKETAAVLPVVLVAYEYCGMPPNEPTQQRRLRSFFHQQWRQLVPYGAVLFLYLMARTCAIHGIPHRTPVPLRLTLLSWPWLLCLYVKMLILPVNLSPLYDFPYVYRVHEVRFILPLVLIVTASAVVWLRRRHQGSLSTLMILWFVITLSPAFLQFLLAKGSESYHDRYLYLPSVAWALLLGVAFEHLGTRANRLQRGLAWISATTLVTILAFGAHRQINFWESNYSLFAQAHQVAPQNELAASNFAAELMKRRQYQEALNLAEQMIRLHPQSVPPLLSAASASFFLHDYVTAERYYQRAVQLEPEQSNPLYLLALTRIRLGERASALEALRMAAALSPREPMMHYMLGVGFAHLGDWTEARDQFRLELQAMNVDGQQDLVRQALRNAEDHLGAAMAPASFSTPSAEQH